ncbi:probable WRKY transcription factor 65 [Cynara cardunculus var. scolymus]|uniref:probable WRKY transcription factor 65 n=1 Tax=Cynara cardunculus var. scolymus TaxID=59895 RepID=UPI000D62CF89|nr:probable WRKY transcription factor 65 [Cynara cardunculus var. scolymus]
MEQDSPLNDSDIQPSKKRKVADKIVVTVKLEGKKKTENPSCDCWSWRKYGQKPIKGSPYPRGYYRCSTSKSCSAKKQVEICRTDASMLIITYTSAHNHPDPALSKESKQAKTKIPHDDSNSTAPEPDQKNEDQKPIITVVDDQDPIIEENDNFRYIQTPENETHLTVDLENTFFDEEPLSYPNLMTFSALKSEENDFYDELEELPMSSSTFKSFMRTNFFEERVLVQPS